MGKWTCFWNLEIVKNFIDLSKFFLSKVVILAAILKLVFLSKVLNLCVDYQSQSFSLHFVLRGLRAENHAHIKVISTRHVLVD